MGGDFLLVFLHLPPWQFFESGASCTPCNYYVYMNALYSKRHLYKFLVTLEFHCALSPSAVESLYSCIQLQRRQLWRRCVVNVARTSSEESFYRHPRRRTYKRNSRVEHKREWARNDAARPWIMLYILEDVKVETYAIAVRPCMNANANVRVCTSVIANMNA